MSAREDRLIVAVKRLARLYVKLHEEANAIIQAKVDKGEANPKIAAALAGTLAHTLWAEFARKQGVMIIARECRTGVTGLKGGQTRFDFLVKIAGVNCWIELQASERSSLRKTAQLQGQLLRTSGETINSSEGKFLFKIIGKTGRIYKYSMTAARKGAYEIV